MSTLMSKDMNLTRPSSRVNRPPGGATTISFGSDPSPAKKAAPAPVAEPEPEPVVVESVPKEAPSSVDSEKKVGVLIGGKVEPDFLAAEIMKALTIKGVKNYTISKVPAVGSLTYASKKLAMKCDVVIAAAFITNDPTGAITQGLTTAMLQIGVNGPSPVIPALVTQSSLLEAKALLPGLAEDWAEEAASTLAIGDDIVAEETPAPEIPVKPVYSKEVKEVDTLMELFRESCKAHGARGIVGIGRKFRIADDDNSKSISIDEFTKVINEHDLGWTKEQIKAVFDGFDADKSGSLDYEEFLEGLRGPMNDRRTQLVMMAFEILDADKSGIVDINDISPKYNATKHPDVIAGRRTEADILGEFLDTFDTEEKDGKVTPAEFLKYYGNVSASIDNDDYFELMIRNAWHISGGEGWCANSSCRRVLVVHTDGRQTVEEIKNDLGMAPDDKEAMKKNLAEQGITDVADIDTKGSSSVSSIAPAADTPPPPPAAAAAAAGMKKQNEQDYRPASRSSTYNSTRAVGGASSIVFG